MSGYWKLEAWKETEGCRDIPLHDSDLEHIAQKIKEGYVEGELV